LLAGLTIFLTREVLCPFAVGEITPGALAGFFEPGIGADIPQDNGAIIIA
jgi:hypothetical protein